MGKDLGTYWLRVEFEDGRGYLEKWETGHRYMHGTDSWKPLDGVLIKSTWTDEQDIFSAMEYQYTDGNYSCDCNKAMFLARAYQQEEPEDPPCGDTMTLSRLTAIRPDGSERVLWEASNVKVTGAPPTDASKGDEA